MKNLLLLFWILLLLLGCGEHASTSEPKVASGSAEVSRSMGKMATDVQMGMQGGAEQSLTEISEPSKATVSDRKYVVLRHHLQIEMPPEKMQAAFDAAVKHCEVLNCQLLSANYNRETQYSSPSASLSLRVPPRSIEIFLTGLAKNGEVIQHGRDSEDKTNQVVDIEARIKNLTSLRDRLRSMLDDKTAKFKDIIEIERELANTQSELDGLTSMRKILSHETDLVLVNIDFTAKQGITEQGFFAPVLSATKDAGRVMMESLAAVITFIMSAIPWLLIGIPVIWLVRKYWSKTKSNL
jgi:Domain of unknown function (DUF4349)